MADPTDTPPLDSDAQVTAAYNAHYRLLEYIAVQKFRVPDDDVRALIHEAFLAFIRARRRVYDERAWLIAVMCNQCRLYWRARARDVSPDRAGAVDACDIDEIVRRVDVSTLLRRLPRRCREVLHLRFFEAYSSEEIAKHFSTTVLYARKMVYRCVSAARSLLRGEASEKGAL